MKTIIHDTKELNEIESSLIGDIGKMLSNNGTQFYMHRRIYNADFIAITICTCANPWYAIWSKKRVKNGR